MYFQVSHGQCSLAPSATHSVFESLVQQPGSVTVEDSRWDGKPATRVNVQSTENASWGRTKVVSQAFYVLPLSWTDENGVEHPEGCAIKLPLGGEATSGGDEKTLTALIDRFWERFTAESVYGVYSIDMQPQGESSPGPSGADDQSAQQTKTPPPTAADELIAVAQSMRVQLQRGDYASVIERRVALDEEITRVEVPPEWAFWLDAYPALAAARLKDANSPHAQNFGSRAIAAAQALPEQTDARQAAIAEIERYLAQH